MSATVPTSRAAVDFSVRHRWKKTGLLNNCWVYTCTACPVEKTAKPAKYSMPRATVRWLYRASPIEAWSEARLPCIKPSDPSRSSPSPASVPA